MAKYYAVKKRRNTGIYLTWDECKEQVSGYSKAVYKSFSSEEEAWEFIDEKDRKRKENKNVNKRHLLAYVDGSYNINTREYGYGCIILEERAEKTLEKNKKEQKIITEFYDSGNSEEYASMHNVAGEILGSIAAIKYANEHNYPSICIFYDYEGIEKWANGKWKTNKIGTKKYAEDDKKYRKNMSIDFKKVAAHSGDYFNERVDKLAKKSVGII